MQKFVFTNSRGKTITLANKAPFILTKFEGEVASSTMLTSKAPGQDGKTLHDALLEEGLLPIEGAIVGSSVQDLYAKKRLLCAIFSPKLDGTITYTNDAGTYTIQCRVQDIPTFKNKVGTIMEFLIQVYCPNPFWTDVLETKEEIATWMGSIQFPFELSADGTEFGYRESNLIVNAKNLGDVECGIRVEFTALASVVNPSILNVYTQEFIKVKRTLSAGDKIIVNTEFGHKKVEMVQNGVKTSVFNYIDLQSTFIQLDVGDNLLRYDAESGIENLNVSLYFTPKYVGV